MYREYNISDLKYKKYTYEYALSWFDEYGDNYINIKGERSGIFFKEEPIDLILGNEVSTEYIIESTPLKNLLDNTSIKFESNFLTLSKMPDLLKEIDETLGYMAYETRGSGCYADSGNLPPHFAQYNSADEKPGILKRQQAQKLSYDSEKEKHHTTKRNLSFVKKLRSKLKKY